LEVSDASLVDSALLGGEAIFVEVIVEDEWGLLDG